MEIVSVLMFIILKWFFFEVQKRFCFNKTSFIPELDLGPLVYDRNHYFGLGPIPKPKPKLADTFGRYRNRYRNYILKGESSYR